MPHFPISRFPIFHHVLRLSTVVAAAFVFAGAAFAQLAPQRTWPELKEAVQQRADRNAYPMTGMKAEDVREILGNIASLDRDEWAKAWTAMGARYAKRGDELAASDKNAAHQAYMMAFRYDAFGAWPTPNAPGKKAAYARSTDDFKKAAATSDPAIEAVTFPYDGKTVHAYLALPKGARPAPVALAIGGLELLQGILVRARRAFPEERHRRPLPRHARHWQIAGQDRCRR